MAIPMLLGMAKGTPQFVIFVRYGKEDPKAERDQAEAAA